MGVFGYPAQPLCRRGLTFPAASERGSPCPQFPWAASAAPPGRFSRPSPRSLPPHVPPNRFRDPVPQVRLVTRAADAPLMCPANTTRPTTTARPTWNPGRRSRETTSMAHRCRSNNHDGPSMLFALVPRAMQRAPGSRERRGCMSLAPRLSHETRPYQRDRTAAAGPAGLPQNRGFASEGCSDQSSRPANLNARGVRNRSGAS
jgi:hypothetical protein